MSEEHQNHDITKTETLVKADSHHETEGAEEGGLLTINGTLVVIVISFVIFIILMQKVFYGPVTAIKNQRNNYLKKMGEDAKNASEESETLSREYQENLNSARKKASDKTSKMVAEANEKKNFVLSDKKQQVNEFLEGQKHILANDEAQALESLKHQVMDFAYKISVKVMGEGTSMESLNPEIVNEAMDKAINKR